MNQGYETMVEYVKAAGDAAASDGGAGADAEPVRPQDVDAVTALNLVAVALSERATRLVADAGFPGLRPSYGRLFGRLQHGPRSVSDLARDLGVTSQAVSKTLRPLVEQGYLTVERGEDARSRIVALDDRGRRAVVAARAARRAVVADLDGRLGGRVGAVVPLLVEVLDDLGILQEALDRRTFRHERRQRGTAPPARTAPADMRAPSLARSTLT